MGDSTAEREVRRRVGLAAARAEMAAADDEYFRRADGGAPGS